RELARARAVRERARLVGERALELREHLRVVGELLLVEVARLLLVTLANQVPRRDEDFLLAARDLVLLAAATAATGLARLREPALERLDLDEVEVALGLAAAIFSDHVVRDQIARLEARFGRRRVGGLSLLRRLIELTAELRHAEIVELEHRARRPRTPVGAHRLRELFEEEDVILGDERAVLAELDRDRPPLAAVHGVAQL